jgi:hypothetical protein
MKKQLMWSLEVLAVSLLAAWLINKRFPTPGLEAQDLFVIVGAAAITVAATNWVLASVRERIARREKKGP